MYFQNLNISVNQIIFIDYSKTFLIHCGILTKYNTKWGNKSSMDNIDWGLTWSMVGSIATALAVITSFIVLFLQRYFDNQRTKEENEGRIALGSFYPEFLRDEVGYYFDTDSSIKVNPFISSEISIPIINVGKTPVSEVEIKVTFPAFDKIIKGWEKDGLNSPLKFHDFTQIYAKYDEGNSIQYNIIYNDHKKEVVFSQDNRMYRIGPIISGERVLLRLSSREELYIQYLLFILNQRSRRENTPNGIGVALVYDKSTSEYFRGFKFQISFKDYLGNQMTKELYLGLFDEGFKEFHSNSNNLNEKIQRWYLAPVNYNHIKDYL